ncbi:MFS transporter [Nocardioides yefusunii]|uniref:MFS transporter n=1 Tax=Nocardioides yefusunii TaxID=2500546 RepID=A0ABW1QXE3_9ACTN|nr:aromatic acid/H+ symport family MFS transporter [Nocardioides yefusunii]
MSSHTAVARAGTSSGLWPVILCWLAMTLDGFDMVVLGAVIPTLDSENALGFTTASLTSAATIGLIGVMIGAVMTGAVADRFGRRLTLVACVILFSIFTFATAFVPNKEMFIAFRFIAGLGLGACLPTALTYMSEYAKAGSASSATTRTMTGYHVGAVITSLMALWLIPHWGWESLFMIGGLAGFALVPFLWFKLPESDSFLAVKEGTVAKVKLSEVVKGRLLAVSIGIWVASFMGLLLVYGLNTWLPKIMSEAGYSVSGGVALLLTLNVGAVIGLFVSGKVADERGNKKAVLVWFGVAAVALALLSIKIESQFVVYAAVLLAGVFVFSAQVLVYAFTAHLYPARIRATALGMSAGVGRVGAIMGPTLGGAMVGAGVAYPWGFYAFAAAAAIAFVALFFVPAHLPLDEKAPADA